VTACRPTAAPALGVGGTHTTQGAGGTHTTQGAGGTHTALGAGGTHTTQGAGGTHTTPGAGGTHTTPGFFAGKGFKLRCPALSRSQLAEPSGKRQDGATSCEALWAVKGVWERSPPTLRSPLSSGLTAAKAAISSRCFILRFWDSFLLSCAGALSTLLKRSEKQK